MTRNAFRTRRSAVLTATTALALTAAALLALPLPGEAQSFEASATLRSAERQRLGTVHFKVTHQKTVVTAHLRLPSSGVARDAFHGFHIHANNNPANGSGCVADPAKPRATWFVSADGHLARAGERHGAHRGDLPSLLVNEDGTADITFTTQRFTPRDLDNRAVILHTGADNFANVPLGNDPDEYSANSSAAVTKTVTTGNAGDRYACGVISLER